MLVKIAVPIAMLFNLKANREATHGLPAEVGNHCFGCEEDGMTRGPNAPAKINFLEVIKKLLVKATQASQKIAAKHYATSGLPIDWALRLAEPTRIFLKKE
jgi:hypothetical protein